mmetsp:Transcript_12073/g.28356  ORF Transcript_12073/g.28356 Transcript_12073/m.28356 type:complete len:285 (-) Transcript_12073:19-873(-)
MSSLCLVLGFGGSKGHVRMAIFASLTVFGICGWLKSLSTMMPCISVVSSSFPPTLPSTLMRSKLTSLRSRVATESTASTLMRASCSLRLLTTLDPSAVLAAFKSAAWSSAWMSTVRAISPILFTATSHARSKPKAMRKGWMPFSMSSIACSSMAPAMTTTPVVPSPISWSWDFERSTSSLAMWCCTSIFSRIVAPSFVTRTSPSGPTTILSIPFGPMELRMVSAMDLAARMFALCAWMPRRRFFFCCSSMMMKGLPNSSMANWPMFIGTAMAPLSPAERGATCS